MDTVVGKIGLAICCLFPDVFPSKFARPTRLDILSNVPTFSFSSYSNSTQEIKSEEVQFIQLVTNTCQLLYVVASDQIEKGTRNIHDSMKSNLDDLTR